MSRRDKLTNSEIIKGICQGDDIVIDFLYEELLSKVFSFVRKNSGSLEDAKDLFQDAILVIYHKAKNENLILSVEFKTYFFAVCRNIWGRKLERKKTYGKIINQLKEMESSGENLEEAIIINERKKLYLDHFEQLNDNCKKAIRLFNEGKSIKEIAAMLNIESVAYVKQMRHRCKEKLENSIKNDPRFNELTKD